MKTTFAKSDLNNSNVRNAIISLIDGAKHGGFIVVHSLKTKTGHGEISDYTFCKGISYKNAVAKSLEMLDAIESDPNFSITVKRGVWQDKQGNVNPTNRKSKVFSVSAVIEETYKQGNPFLSNAILKLRLSLIAPQAPTKDYKALGNGIYEDENGGLFLRDLRLVSKTILAKGDYPFSAQGEEVAIAETMKRDMPVGKYRQFNLDGDYDSISIDGMEIEQEKETVMAGELVEA
jgi:hypothetical protein